MSTDCSAASSKFGQQRDEVAVYHFVSSADLNCVSERVHIRQLFVSIVVRAINMQLKDVSI